MARASSAFCSTTTIATPSRLMAPIVSNNRSAAIGASPAEGSSSRSRLGSTISAMAMARICRCPPDSVRAAWRRRSASSGKRAKIASMRGRAPRGSR